MTGSGPAGLPAGGPVGPLVGFASAAAAATAELARLVPSMDLWLVTHVVQDRQVVVARAGRWADLAPPGVQFAWQASFCVRMVTGQAPSVAPRIKQVPAYRQVALGPLTRVKAYLGVPLMVDESELFGTLCAFAGTEQPDGLAQAMPTVTLLARMLSTVLAGERHAHDRSVDAAAAYALADRDPATGLRNQRGFQRALELENGRIRRFGTTASVLVIDVNDPAASPGREAQLAGDSGLISCAGLLAGVAQPGDVLARIDPSVFALLAVGTDAAGAQAMRTQLAQALRTADLTAAIGTATHRAGEDLTAAWQQARAGADRRHH